MGQVRAAVLAAHEGQQGPLLEIALVLAGRLDDVADEAEPSAVAPVARELRAVLAELDGREVPEVSDGVDELARRRADRRSAGPSG